MLDQLSVATTIIVVIEVNNYMYFTSSLLSYILLLLPVLFLICFSVSYVSLCKKKAHMASSTSKLWCAPGNKSMLQLFSSYRIPFHLSCCSQWCWLPKSENNTGYFGICHQMISMLSHFSMHHLKCKVLASLRTGSHYCVQSSGCSRSLDIQHMHQQPAWEVLLICSSVSNKLSRVECRLTSYH